MKHEFLKVNNAGAEFYHRGMSYHNYIDSVRKNARAWSAKVAPFLFDTHQGFDSVIEQFANRCLYECRQDICAGDTQACTSRCLLCRIQAQTVQGGIIMQSIVTFIRAHSMADASLCITSAREPCKVFRCDTWQDAIEWASCALNEDTVRIVHYDGIIRRNAGNFKENLT